MIALVIKVVVFCLFFIINALFFDFFEKSFELFLFLRKKIYFSRAIAMRGLKHLSPIGCLNVFIAKKVSRGFLRKMYRIYVNCTGFCCAVNFFSTFFEKILEIVW